MLGGFQEIHKKIIFIFSVLFTNRFIKGLNHNYRNYYENMNVIVDLQFLFHSFCHLSEI